MPQFYSNYNSTLEIGSGAASTWNGPVSFSSSGTNAVYRITPVEPEAPAPRTEVERLLSDVEQVCALAR